MEFFLNLCEGADTVLGTHYVDQFLHHACYDHYKDLRDTMLRMLAMKDNEHARDIAGRQITVTSFHNELAKEDLAAVLPATQYAAKHPRSFTLITSNNCASPIFAARTCHDSSTMRTKTFVAQRLTVSETSLPTDCMTSNH